MAEVAAVIKNNFQAEIGKVRLAGKIYGVRKSGEHFYTAILSPARDEWSSPSRFEVRSKVRLGEKEDVVNLDCSLGGMSKPFSYKDRETGEARTGHNFIVFLDVVE